MDRIIIAAAIGALAGTAAGAAGPICYKPVSSGTPYAGSLAPLNDGIVPANGSAYNTGAEVHDYPATVVFSLDFGKPVTIGDILATVDNNDDYRFDFFDFSKGGNGSIAPKLRLTIQRSDGVVAAVPGGVETFASFATPGATTLPSLKFAPVVATTVNVYTSGGDGRFAVGEVEFFAPPPSVGRPSRTPGPCTAAIRP